MRIIPDHGSWIEIQFDTADIIQPCRDDWPDKTEEDYLNLIIQYIDVNDIPVDQDDIFNRMNIARIKSEDDFYDEVDEVIDNIYMDHVTRYIQSNNIPINPNDIMMRIDTTAIHTVVDLNVAVDRVLHDIILGDTDTQ